MSSTKLTDKDYRDQLEWITRTRDFGKEVAGRRAGPRHRRPARWPEQPGRVPVHAGGDVMSVCPECYSCDCAAIEVHDHGSIILFRPLTDTGSDWLNDHLVEPQMWGVCFAVDQRMAGPILDGATQAGLRVIGL